MIILVLMLLLLSMIHFIQSIGDLSLISSTGSSISMNNIYYVLGMKKILISISQIMDKGYSILFGPNTVKIYTNVKIFGELIT